jgi:arylsulfatase A-like enzyme/Tfp pilus assembly protein PilF
MPAARISRRKTQALSSRGSPVPLFAVALAIAAVAGLGGWWIFGERRFTLDQNADRNVLIVTIDTLRADALGSYGGGSPTPNLDRLSASGARFDAAHAHAVVTLPSHASIMSGTYPYEHGVRDNTGYRFSPKQPTIATLLEDQGFATGAFIGGFPLDRRFGLNAGFDTYDDRLGSPSGDDVERERPADAVIASANEWIAQQQGKWFAWVHLYDPHATYTPPREFVDPASPYSGEVRWTDHALGALFGGLESQPRDTLIIVTADHGESLGDHGELTHGIFAYEAVLRVPLIIAEARATGDDPPAGVTVLAPVRHVDLLPTVLDAIGAPAAAGLAGASLRPLIDGGDDDERASYFEAMSSALTRGWAPLRGVVAGRAKYIDLPIPELYDLAADPRESENLAERESARAHEMFQRLRAFDVAPPARAQAETSETIERLRSLGYISGGAADVRETYTEADDPKRLIELEQLLQRATEAQRQGRATEAIEIYEHVIARRADTEDAYRKLALVYWRQGRPAEAIATLERALKSGVTQSEVRIKLAEYLAQSGQPARAIELLEATAGEDPDALIALGNAYTLAGRVPEALATFQRLLALDPSNALVYENMGAAQLRRRDFPAAERSLRRAIELDGHRAGAHTALGVLLAETGRRVEAIDAWRRAVTIDPGELNALFNLTVNLVEAGRPDEAREYGERFIALAPRSLQKDVVTIRRQIRDEE